MRNLSAKKRGIRTVIGVPLCHDSVNYGVLVFGSSKNKNALHDEIHLLRNLELYLGPEVYRKSLEDDFRRVFETVPDILCKIDFNSTIKKMNKAGLEILGYDEEELSKIKFTDLIYQPDREMARKKIAEKVKKESSFDSECRVIKKNGEVIWLSWSFKVYPQEEIHYAIAKDITSKKEYLYLLDNATDLARIGGWELDLQTEQIYWSPMTREIHGVDPDFKVDLKSGIHFYREDHRDKIEQIILQY